MQGHEYRKSIEVLAHVENLIKSKLSLIGAIDQKIQKISVELEDLREKYLSMLYQSNEDDENESLKKQMEQTMIKIYSLEQELDDLTEQKIDISSELQIRLDESCERFDETIDKEERKMNIAPNKNVTYQNYESDVVRTLHETDLEYLKEYARNAERKEMKNYCVCLNKQNNKSQMIMCEEPNCQFQWFHLNCLGLATKDIPEGVWKCDFCLTKKIRDITFQMKNQKITKKMTISK